MTQCASNRYLISGLGLALFLACSPALPSLPEDCPSGRCECTVNADCSTDAPLCLAGVCTTSEEPEVLWDHARRVLDAEHPIEGELRDLHGVDLGVAIATDSSHQLIAGFLTVAERAVGNWRVMVDDGDNHIAAHPSGLLVVAPNPSHSRVWRPRPADIRRSGPGLSMDMRSLVGYDLLLKWVTAAARAGVISTPTPVTALEQGEHFVDLGKPLHRMVSDLYESKAGLEVVRNGEAYRTRLPSLAGPEVLALMDHGQTRAHDALARHPAYPEPRFPNAPESARTIAIELVQEGMVNVRMVARSELNDCGDRLAVFVNDDGTQSPIPVDRALSVGLPPGRHSVMVFINPLCRSLGVWLRIEVDSTGPIDLQYWRTELTAPLDGNRRPTLYNLAAGPVVDSDGDRIPDGSDSDGDGTPEPGDLCPDTPDNGADSDQDGIGDACDGIGSIRLMGNEIILLDGQGETVRSVTRQAASTPVFAASVPMSFAANHPGSSVTNPHAKQPAMLFQESKGDPVWILGETEAMSEERPAENLRLIDAMNLASNYGMLGQEEVKLHRLTLWNSALGDRTRSRYDLFADNAAFTLASPSNPALLLRDSGIGSAAYVAMSLPTMVRGEAFSAHTLLSLLHPPRTFCTPQIPCQPIMDGDHSVERVCSAFNCIPAPSEGLCAKRNDDELVLHESTFAACREDADCGEGKVCLSRTVSADPNAAPLAYAIGAALGLRSIGTVIPVPVVAANRIGEARVKIGACLKARVSYEGEPTLDTEQRQTLLRQLFDRRVASAALFEPAHVVIAENPLDLEDPDFYNHGRCLPLQTSWKAHFSSALKPVDVELVDTDGDGLDEVKVGLILGTSNQANEPTVYRCFDFTGAHRSEGCGD